MQPPFDGAVGQQVDKVKGRSCGNKRSIKQDSVGEGCARSGEE